MCLLNRLVLFCGLAAVPGAATTYYVDPSGANTNSGSAANPFATLTAAVAVAGPGDTIIVNDGVYGPGNAVTRGDGSQYDAIPVVLKNSGTPGAWITIKAANKWGAVLDCQMTCDAYIDLYNSSYVVMQDFVITRGYKEGIHSNNAANNIVLRGNRIEYIANRTSNVTTGLDGMYTNPQCHDFLIDGNVFHDIGRTNSNWLDHALYLHGSNFIITNNLFYNIPHGWSIQAADGLNNVVIANNTFSFPNGNGQNGQIMLWGNLSNITIQSNAFYQPLNFALTRYRASLISCSVAHNVVFGAALIADSTGCSTNLNITGVTVPPANSQ